MRKSKHLEAARRCVCPVLPRWLLTALFICGICVVRADGTFHDRQARFKTELAASPDNPEILLRMADLYNEPSEHSDWKLALRLANQVEKIAPGQWPTDFVRAQAWIQGEKWQKARAELDHYLQRLPKERRALVLRGRVLDWLDQGESCLADFRVALWDTGRPDPEIVQETSFYLEKYGQPDEALSVLDFGIGQIGVIPSLVTAAVEMEIRLQRWDAALVRVSTMQKSAQRPEPWMARCAEILTQAGRSEDAKTAWELLVSHLKTLPPSVRQSHSMMLLLEKAVSSLKTLETAPEAIGKPRN